jgi:hypothetical protein
MILHIAAASPIATQVPVKISSVRAPARHRPRRDEIFAASMAPNAAPGRVRAVHPAAASDRPELPEQGDRPAPAHGSPRLNGNRAPPREDAKRHQVPGSRALLPERALRRSASRRHSKEWAAGRKRAHKPIADVRACPRPGAHPVGRCRRVVARAAAVVAAAVAAAAADAGNAG